MDYKKHNEEVAKLRDDYNKGCNAGVPITIAFDEQFLLPFWDCTFRQYYEDVKTQIDIQLKSQKWIRENILQDSEMGLPDTWYVTPPSWMAENEFFGAEIVIQENDYSWGKPIPLPKKDLLQKLQKIDVRDHILQSKLFCQYEEIKKYTENMEFCGRPVKVSNPFSSTHGIFTKAAEIRGLEQICLDFLDDPIFLKELLETITNLSIERIKIWYTLFDPKQIFPLNGVWGLADDSLTMVSAKLYKEFVLPCHQKIYSEMTTGPRSIHLCGKVQHLFKILHDKLGITIFNGPGPQINLLQMINEINKPIEIQAEIAHATLLGSYSEIEKAIQTILNEEVKKCTKIMLLGYAPKDTSLSNLEFFYKCGKRYGQITK